MAHSKTRIGLRFHQDGKKAVCSDFIWIQPIIGRYLGAVLFRSPSNDTLSTPESPLSDVSQLCERPGWVRLRESWDHLACSPGIFPDRGTAGPGQHQPRSRTPPRHPGIHVTG